MNGLCECGCGERVSKPGNRFVKGHTLRGRGPNSPNWKGGPVKVTCAFCGKTVLRNKDQVKRSSNHFCNTACYAQWRSENLIGPNHPSWNGGPTEVTCAFCGEKIRRKKSRADKYSNHFCSAACQARWQSETRSGPDSPGWQGGPIEVACAFCGETILRAKWQAEEHSNHFCSAACQVQWRSEKWKGPNSPTWNGGPAEVECAFCGEAILRDKSQIKMSSNQFCNAACHAQWRSENQKGAAHPSWQGGPTEVACAFCGEKILRKKNEIKKSSNLFCSAECYAHWRSENWTGENGPNWRGGPIEVICAFCGKKIRKCKAQTERARNHFCSKACHDLWQAGVNGSSWQGGKSFEPYTPQFNGALKLTIRERDGFTCQLCSEPENGKAHHCHHVDYDKQNSDPDNLSLLCHSCHSKTSRNRAFWTNLFQAQVKLGRARSNLLLNTKGGQNEEGSPSAGGSVAGHDWSEAADG